MYCFSSDLVCKIDGEQRIVRKYNRLLLDAISSQNCNNFVNIIAYNMGCGDQKMEFVILIQFN